MTVLATVALASGASAALLIPGASAAPDVIVAPSPADTLLATITRTFAGVNALGETRFTGSFVEQVWRMAVNPVLGTTNTLNFYFQFTNDASSDDAIEHFSVTNYKVSFAGDVIDVGFVPNAAAALAAPGFVPPFSVTGTDVPVLVSRQSGSGAVVDFSFPGTLAVQPGSTTQILAIQTKATNFSLGTAQFQDGAVVSVLDLGPIPEASTVVGFGSLMGLGGLGMLRLRRRSKNTASA